MRVQETAHTGEGSQDIPDGWAPVNVGELLQLNYGKGLKEADRTGRSVPVYGSNGIVGYHDIALTSGPTIVVGRKGTVGAVHFSPVPCWPIDTTYFIDDFRGLHQMYVLHALRSLGLEELDTSTAVPGLNRDDAYRQVLLLPPLAEQERIANAIDALVDQVRISQARLARVPTILKRFRQAVLAAACSGRLTADWRDVHPDTEPASSMLQQADDIHEPDPGLVVKQRRVNKAILPALADEQDEEELPGTWTWARIGEIADIQNGRAFPSAQYQQSGVRLLRPGNLHISGIVDWSADRTAHLPEQWSDKYPEFLLGENELVMNLTAQSLRDEFLGRVCIKHDNAPALLNQRIARFSSRVAGDVRPYLYYYFKSPRFRSYVNTLDTGSLIRHMHTRQVLAHVAPLPPIAEQHEIVRRVEALFKLSDAIERRVAAATARADKLTQAILAKAFRGELVPTEAELARREVRSYEPASVLLEGIRQRRDQQEGTRGARRGHAARQLRRPS